MSLSTCWLVDTLLLQWLLGAFFGLVLVFVFFEGFFFIGNILVARLVAVLPGCLTYLARSVWGGSPSLVKREQEGGYPALAQCGCCEDAINLGQGGAEYVRRRLVKGRREIQRERTVLAPFLPPPHLFSPARSLTPYPRSCCPTAPSSSLLPVWALRSCICCACSQSVSCSLS